MESKFADKPPVKSPEIVRKLKGNNSILSNSWNIAFRLLLSGTIMDHGNDNRRFFALNCPYCSVTRVRWNLSMVWSWGVTGRVMTKHSRHRSPSYVSNVTLILIRPYGKWGLFKTSPHPFLTDEWQQIRIQSSSYFSPDVVDDMDSYSFASSGRSIDLTCMINLPHDLLPPVITWGVYYEPVAGVRIQQEWRFICYFLAYIIGSRRNMQFTPSSWGNILPSF